MGLCIEDNEVGVLGHHIHLGREMMILNLIQSVSDIPCLLCTAIHVYT